MKTVPITLVKHINLIAFFFLVYVSNAQVPEAQERLNQFVTTSCETSYTEIHSEALTQILKYKVYHITKKIHNIYGSKEDRTVMFIVLDDGTKVNSFESIKTNTELPELYSYIRSDFKLSEDTAPLFESVLDQIYPIEEWKPDKREFLFKNGKWYFLRDAYFRTKQGFEVSIDADGKITSIRYKMKWDENKDS